MSSFEVALVLLSAAFHAVWSLAIKGSDDPLAFNWLQAVATGGLALLLLPLVPFSELSPAFWWALVAAGFCHAFYMYGLGAAYSSGDLSLVYPIARSTPAFLPLVAVPLLGEQLSAGTIGGIALVVVGLWLVPFERASASGGGVGFAAFRAPSARFAVLALLATIGYGITDKLAMVELDAVGDAEWGSPVPRAVLYFFASALGTSVVITPLALRRAGRVRLRASFGQWRRQLAAIAISLASYGLILEALRSAQASQVVAVRQVSVVFVLLLGVLWLGERPGPVRVAGALLTVAGVGLVALAGGAGP